MSIDPVKLGNECRWLELAALGRDAWNTWGKEELKKPLKQRSKVDLAGQEIRHTDFAEFIFPGVASFGGAKFQGHAFFSRAHFVGRAEFGEAKFVEDATFQRTKFSATASFHSCSFLGAVGFSWAKFEEAAFFNASDIVGFAHFNKVRFADRVEFSAICFHDSAVFSETAFLSDVRFINTRFLSVADFEGVTFDQLARFEGAQFAQPPALDATDFKHPPIFLDATFRFHKSLVAHARYRRLKKFAAEAQDHQAELNLFALETKARRGYVLKWTRPRDWIELVLSLLYGVTSDYGRSVFRPTLALLSTFVLGAGSLALATGARGAPWAWSGSVWRASLLNLLPFAGQSVIGRQVMESQLCPQVAGSPDLPCLGNLYEISVAQGFLAVIFLFLLVLGTRNLFRIR